MIIFRKSVTVTLTVSFVLALLLWLGLQLNDEFMGNRNAGYIPTLLTLQQQGLDAAKSMFPCGEDRITGCEPYKTIPAVVGVNTVVFFTLLLLPIHILRRWSTTLD